MNPDNYQDTSKLKVALEGRESFAGLAQKYKVSPP
ncbi:MAG: hypothetical protein ACI9IP_001526 [Arcticibacterium sp.]|jgi:hypothetical protein